jgi:DNA recombination protein RmuC
VDVSIVLAVLATGIVLGLALGGALGWALARARTAERLARLQALAELTHDHEERVETLTERASHQQVESFARLVTPLAASLDKVERHVAQVERDRAASYAGLREQVRGMQLVSEDLRDQTGRLLTALRAPQVRGRWGEVQLRRLVEVAGMVEHCDFAEQVTATDTDGTLRPDMVVTLAGGKQVVVDAKAPFAAYLEAMEAADERTRDARLDAHARHLRGHIGALAGKAYWARFDPTPEFVVLFLPADTFLDAALARDATLLEDAFARNVVLATPATLVALLRTVAYTWRQESLARNAAEVHQLGKELYARLCTLGDHMDRLGRGLAGAVERYNAAVGSLEGRVLVTARRLADLQVSTAELETPAQVDTAPRRLQAPELVDDTGPAPGAHTNGRLP